jgi:RNA polymerase sigma factor (sigma-70 family)
MSAKDTSAASSGLTTRKEQEELLRQKEAELKGLASEGKKEEFFNQITPLLGPLKSYIKRRLRIAYLDLEIRTPVYTSGDILDQVVLRAYENYAKKPENLTLEQWLYQIANEEVEKYLRKRKSIDKRRKSLETLTHAELRTLEELPITADADGEVWFPEELDDSEYSPRDFAPPAYRRDPEEQLEREEQVMQILRALSRVPERDRIVFELFVIEGFSEEAVAKIANVPPDEVPRLAEKVKAQVLRELTTERGVKEKQKAS